MDKWGDGGAYENTDYDNRPDPYEPPGVRRPVKWELTQGGGGERRKAGE